MKKARNGFINTLPYLCLVGVIVLGLMTIVGTGGGGGGGGGGETPSNTPPELTEASEWCVENIDPSFWTKKGNSANATAFRNFWVYASDPDGIDDITYVTVTNPEGTYWILRDSSTGKDHYDPEGGFFGGWERYYSSSYPNIVYLGQYSVLVRDSAGHEVVDSIDFLSPGSSSGNGFLYSEDYTGSTDGGVEMLKRASVTNFNKEENNITIDFQVDDARVYNGYVWFYDDIAEYITWSDHFKNSINSGAGLYNDGTTNTLQIQSSDLDLGSYTWGDIKGFHVVLKDGAQFAPEETSYDHRSISQYRTFTETEIDGLIACYSFDENYGNVALDATGNDHHGDITAASRVEGKIGNGLLFGFDNAYVKVDDGLYFDEGLITIEAWIKPYEMETGEVYRIIGDYNYHGFYFQIRDGRLEILYEGQSYHYGTTSIPVDVWTHIAFTSDGTDIITYVNGVEDGRTNITLPVQNILNIRIGAHRIYTGGSPLTDYVEEFPGIIDELRIWDGVRTSDEIQQYYDSTM